MKRFLTALVTAVFVISGLAACGNEAEGKAPLNGTQEYESIEAIGSDLRAGDISCEPKQDKNSTAFTEGGRCDTFDGDLVMGIFTNDSQLAEYKRTINWVQGLMKEPGYLVIGENWVINCGSSPRLASMVTEAIGGQTWVSKS